MLLIVTLKQKWSQGYYERWQKLRYFQRCIGMNMVVGGSGCGLLIWILPCVLAPLLCRIVLECGGILIWNRLSSQQVPCFGSICYNSSQKCEGFTHLQKAFTVFRCLDYFRTSEGYKPRRIFSLAFIIMPIRTGHTFNLVLKHTDFKTAR